MYAPEARCERRARETFGDFGLRARHSFLIFPFFLRLLLHLALQRFHLQALLFLQAPDILLTAFMVAPGFVDGVFERGAPSWFGSSKNTLVTSFRASSKRACSTYSFPLSR